MLLRTFPPTSPSFLSYSDEEKIFYHLNTFYAPLISFLLGWLDVVDNDSRFEILVHDQAELKGNETEKVNEVVTFLGFPENLRSSHIPTPKEGEKHFRKAERGEWKHAFPKKICEITTRMLPSYVIDRFGW